MYLEKVSYIKAFADYDLNNDGMLALSEFKKIEESNSSAAIVIKAFLEQQKTISPYDGDKNVMSFLEYMEAINSFDLNRIIFSSDERANYKNQFDILKALAIRGDGEAVRTLLVYLNGYDEKSILAKEILDTLNLTVLKNNADNGDAKCVNALMWFAVSYEYVQTRSDEIKNILKSIKTIVFRENAEKGSIECIEALVSLKECGNPSAGEELTKINPAVYEKRAENNEKQVLNILETLACNDNKLAADMIMQLAERKPNRNIISSIIFLSFYKQEKGLSAEEMFLKALSPDIFMEDAKNGSSDAIGILLDLKEYYVKNEYAKSKEIDSFLRMLDLSIVKIKAEEGDVDAVNIFFDLKDSGYDVAINYIKTINPHAVMNKIDMTKTIYDAEYEVGDEILAIKSLAENKNKEGFNCLMEIAKNGNQYVLSNLINDTRDYILEYRQQIITYNLPKDNIDKSVADFTRNNAFALYSCFSAEQNHSMIIDYTYRELVRQSNGQKFIDYIKELDPKKIFIRDFLAQAAKYQLIGDILQDAASIKDAVDIVFQIQDKDMAALSPKIAGFVENVLKNQNLSDDFKKAFEQNLLEIYDLLESDPNSSNIKKHLIASILSTFKGDITYLSNEKINAVEQKNKIEIKYKEIPYSQIGEEIHIVFADMNAMGHMSTAAKYFKDFKDVKIIDGFHKKYDIKKDLESHVIRMIISRGHIGSEYSVFSQPSDDFFIAIVSSCYSESKREEFEIMYPNAEFIAIKDIGRGKHTNKITEWAREGLLIKNADESHQIKTYRELRDYIIKNVNDIDITDNYTFPDDPTWLIKKEIVRFESSQ